MLIRTEPGRTIYCCDDCGIIKDVQSNNKNRHSLTHRCVKCHAKSNSVSAAQAMVKKYKNTNHFELLGKKLREWHSNNPEKSTRICHENGAIAVSRGLPSIAGRIGGRVTAEKGYLAQISSLGHTPKAKEKRYKTLRERGKLWSSKSENNLDKRLRNLFENVTHWVTEGGFSIDFYVQDVDCYVQLDGIYWHGLDRPYEDLHAGPRAKFDRDRKCDTLFKSISKRLVRITDVALDQMTDEELKARLMSEL